MANEQGGAGHYPGPNHTPHEDVMDWITARECGGRAARPRLLPASAAGQLRELHARRAQAAIRSVLHHPSGSSQ